MMTDSASARSASRSSNTASSIESTLSELVGEECDALIPTATEISQTFHDGIKTWSRLLRQAQAMLPELWPIGFLNPYIALRDAPCLPAKVPNSTFLYGRPRWHMPDPEMAETAEVHDWNQSLLYGPRVAFLLGNVTPIQCDTNPRATTMLLGSNAGKNSCHAVLVMCWSYIFSVRFLEMQGRQVRYSKSRLWPKSEYEELSICLDGASAALTRWLCAILCSDMGWTPQNGLFPPWAACLTKSPGLVITSQTPSKEFAAPSSAEATRLLLELCEIFDLDTELTSRHSAILPPPRAAFLAVMMLPFYRFMGLRPQLPPPNMYPNTKHSSNAKRPSILEYLRDIRYFMTLSIHPPSLGSILWSILWQPDINCNLVSPWLASFIEVLGETIDNGNLEIFLKVLVSRRPRVAIWWLALFLLGDLSVLQWFRRYAETYTEMPASGTLSLPDLMVSAWSGSKQSFLDFRKTTKYIGPEDWVLREDLLRCKVLFQLQERSFFALSWRPFGHIKMQDVEPELWPYLESEYTCTYDSFSWYQNGKLFHTSYGFRLETGRDVKNVPDNLVRLQSEVRCHNSCRHDIKSKPGKICTMKMVSLLAQDVAGGRHWANTALPAAYLQHHWLRDWRGLETSDTSVNQEQETVVGVKPLSPFVLEWVHRQAK